ncbi:MAG: hypothetical protein UX41_C0013G0009 [Candidatus Collierbacteria bacterium GW2011_GWE1_46_18]|uniref:Uncharacterized protein n=1 Tax=Candidatus Collierbacteria bacterium GW2011_GWE1_46_18 TaxID=1618399 RepID=A0A0G1PAD3_9BACT|nr:MAG: hypothetical protein UX41_C0013G0009 [Candidatus Collierbacteria bacterium GW2011_GWE1_46_18]
MLHLQIGVSSATAGAVINQSLALINQTILVKFDERLNYLVHNVFI